MIDINKMEPPERKAAMQGGTWGWGIIGSSDDHLRYMLPVEPKSRLRCHCGCKQRATHRGMCNGVGMVSGCELKIRRWVKEQTT